MAIGAMLFAVASTQPAWIGERIGPGLFAQWLSALVVILSLVWLVLSVFERDAPADRSAHSAAPSILPGLGLLSGVAVFGLTLPLTGLVVACALAALVVGWGAGERGVSGSLYSAASGAAIALGLGLTLLPPGTRLWPDGF